MSGVAAAVAGETEQVAIGAVGCMEKYQNRE